MINLADPKEAKALKSNVHATFDSPQGKEVMKFMEQIGSWTPNVMDPMDTNSIVARDANRRLIGTLKTILEISSDQIVALATES
jgi:hypothetical protein